MSPSPDRGRSLSTARATRLATLVIVAATLFTAGQSPVFAEEPFDWPIGTTGVALTALQGAEIQRIPVRFIGTMKDFVGPGYDVHLVELEGEVGESVGVAAGMSGSPVYFGDELIGALAYRMGGLPKRAIAGVMPMADMLQASAVGAAPVSDSSVRAIATPIAASGLVPAVRQWLAPDLESQGFTLVQGSSGSSSATAMPFKPGSPIGVGLVRGDMAIAATGTVTHVDGDEIYAFGHPFFGSGRVELPMHTASVVHTLADLLGSSKMSAVGREVGAIYSDRLAAIVGRLGQQARMIPVRLHVRGAAYTEREFAFDVVRHRTLTPILGGAVVANALIGNNGFDQEATLFAQGAIEIDGLGRLPLAMSVAGESPTQHALALAGQLRQTLALLLSGARGDAEITSLELTVDARAEDVRYTLESIHYDRGPLRPGQLLEIRCALRRWRGAIQTVQLELRIPEDVNPQSNLRLAVGAPDRVQVAIDRPIARRVETAADVGAVVQALGDRAAAHTLQAVLYEATPGVYDRGVALADLPPTAQHLLSRKARERTTRTTRVAVRSMTDAELDGPIAGGLAVRLQVAQLSNDQDADKP